jgi:hypothetical protein
LIERDLVTERAATLVGYLRGMRTEELDRLEPSTSADLLATEETLRDAIREAIEGRVASRSPDWEAELKALCVAVGEGAEAVARDVVRQMTPTRAALLILTASERMRLDEQRLLKAWLCHWSSDELSRRLPVDGA